MIRPLPQRAFFCSLSARAGQAHRSAGLYEPDPRRSSSRTPKACSRPKGLRLSWSHRPTLDPPKLVAAGKAEIAISYQPQLHMQVAEGLPLADRHSGGGTAQHAGRSGGRSNPGIAIWGRRSATRSTLQDALLDAMLASPSCRMPMSS